MRNKTIQDEITSKVYEFLEQKHGNFTFHVHFFTHDELIENVATKNPLFVFALRKDKGAAKFANEYVGILRDVEVPVEFDGCEYKVKIVAECRKQKEN